MAFRVGIVREYLGEDGRPLWEGYGRVGLEAASDLEVEFLPEHPPIAEPRLLDAYDAVIWSSTPCRASSFAGLSRLALIARFGVGYDAIDLDAATRAGVLVTITRGAPDRPVAEGALAMMLALGHELALKDRTLRAGAWRRATPWMGVELRDRTIGILGFGGIGRELARLLQPFGARLLAFDPFPTPEAAAHLGVSFADLDTVLAESDFLSVHCPLTAETRGLLGEAELRRMRPSAFLVNTARGPIVDQEALTRALQEGWIRGAALDVFREEPLPPDHPLRELDNVLLSPHAVALTEELYRDYHLVIAEQLLALQRGAAPAHIVNPAAAETAAFRRKLAAIRARAGSQASP